MLLLTFTAGANRYAIDVARVIEIVPRVELRNIPHAPAVLAGLLGYRGKVVLVIDLGLLLGVGACQDCLSTRIILVDDLFDDNNESKVGYDAEAEEITHRPPTRKPATHLLGLVAEHVSDLNHIRPEQIIPASIRLPDAPYLGAIVQTEEGIIQLIAVEQIRETSLRSFHLGQDTGFDSKASP